MTTCPAADDYVIEPQGMSHSTNSGSHSPGEDDLAVVRRLLDLVGSLDVEAALELLADDVIIELPFRGDGGPRQMEAGVARNFVLGLPGLFAELAFVDVVVHGALASGEIVAEYRSEGSTHRGGHYRNQYVAFFTLDDSRVSGWREFFDPAVVATAFPADGPADPGRATRPSRDPR